MAVAALWQELQVCSVKNLHTTTQIILLHH